jgi:hypothetical protein
MTTRGGGILAFTFGTIGTIGTIAWIGCSSSAQHPDASGSGGSGGSTGAGGGNDASDGPCSGFQTFQATPVAPDAGVGPCTFDIPPPDNCSGGPVVRLDNGQSVAPDPQNGWSYTDNTLRTIQIRGPNCDAIMAGTAHTVCIEYECTSDRNAKRDFGPVDGDAILERLLRLPISTWRYKADARGARHIGPMAQDFRLSFDVGANDTTIYPLDESGVAFAAIQALNAKLDRLAAENARLTKQIAALRARDRAR